MKGEIMDRQALGSLREREHNKTINTSDFQHTLTF